jgi:ribosomal protein S18 acetylase RimI-like enzyme
VLLADDLLERAGAHAYGKRRGGVVRGRQASGAAAVGTACSAWTIRAGRRTRAGQVEQRIGSRLVGVLGSHRSTLAARAVTDVGETGRVTCETYVDADQIRAVLPDDPFVRWSVPAPEDGSPVEGLVVGSAVGWLTTSRRGPGRWLHSVGPAADVAALVAQARRVADDLGGATILRAAVPLLAPEDDLDEPNEWDWFVTSDEPPVQPLEELVSWVAPGDQAAEAALQLLLDEHSPRFSARPGESKVQRWCVLTGPDGEIQAAAAHVEHVPGVAHLASIVTRTDLRGRGLGAAVTAWITRRLLLDGHPVVTLGMYADNDTARRMYHRLGYVDTHHFASGSFARPTR